MGQPKKGRETATRKPSGPRQPSTELDEEALQEVSGGACVKGEHIKDGQVTVRP